MLLKLFLSFMKIGALSFGGAYASIPLVEKEIVEIRQWMTYAEFADMVSLDELTPGPIIINCASFAGMKAAGVPGAAIASLGCILPSCIISLILIWVYRKYKKISFMESALHALKCMAIALIFSTFLKILMNAVMKGQADVNYLAAVLIPCAFFILRKYKISPLYVMLGCGLINVLIGSLL